LKISISFAFSFETTHRTRNSQKNIHQKTPKKQNSNIEQKSDMFGERVCFRAFTSGAKELLLLPEDKQVTLIKQLSGVNVSLCVSMCLFMFACVRGDKGG
jgi:hypothetical protein